MDRSCSIFFLLLKVTTEWLIEDARFLDPNTTGVGGGGFTRSDTVRYGKAVGEVRPFAAG